MITPGDAVRPAELWANGLYLGKLWGGKKRFGIRCGACGHVWREKVPIAEPTSAICPACRRLNRWSLVAWDRTYAGIVGNYEPQQPIPPDVLRMLNR